MRSNRTFSLEENLRIINLIGNNETLVSVARKFDIQTSVIKQWKRLYNSEGIEGLQRK